MNTPGARRIARWVAHALLFGLCLELCARADDALSYHAPFFGRYSAELLRTADEEGIVRNQPGARFEKWKINSLGFRGDGVAREKPVGKARVMCLGQSESFGLYEGEGGEWPARLGRLLAPTQTEVIDASVVGTSRKTRLAYLDKYLLPLRPDVLVLYLNPLNEASSALRDPNPDVPDPSLRASLAAQDRGRLRQLRVLPKLQQRLLGALPVQVASSLREWAQQRRLRRLEASVLKDEPPLDLISDAAVASFEAHLRRVIAHLRAVGVQPVLVTYPTLVHEENLDRDRFYLDAERTWHIWFSERGLLDASRRMNEAQRRVASETRTLLVDADAAVPRTREYFADDVHYTDRGAQLVAELVAGALLSSGALAPAQPTSAPAARSSEEP